MGNEGDRQENRSNKGNVMKNISKLGEKENYK